jgi:hypothetical protein
MIACTAVGQVNIYFRCHNPKREHHREGGFCGLCVKALIGELEALQTSKEEEFDSDGHDEEEEEEENSEAVEDTVTSHNQ